MAQNVPPPGPLPGPLPILPCIIFLNGYPGVGKLTIAKALASHVPTRSCRLINRHVLLEAVQAIEPTQSPYHDLLRDQVRDVLFNALKNIPDQNLVIITTACLGATAPEVEQFLHYVDIARERKVPMFTFNISCNESVNIQRLCSVTERKTQSVDRETLKRMRGQSRLMDPLEPDIDTAGLNIFHWNVDTSDYSAEEVARRVTVMVYSEMEYLLRRCQQSGHSEVYCKGDGEGGQRRLESPTGVEGEA
ncbi:uncharacterized protein RSE6_10083 [Rhynchosporium secalis]|uniref:Uncharacterized protein n=1 Tax=Rhynchosporium secalis TaxID=38038 RepID=A0A1E1MJL6_RHYSE|nr:uncharacterized protein RSE6_10083 [Rhynchosporium secalis]